MGRTENRNGRGGRGCRSPRSGRCGRGGVALVVDGGGATGRARRDRCVRPDPAAALGAAQLSGARARPLPAGAHPSRAAAVLRRAEHRLASSTGTSVASSTSGPRSPPQRSRSAPSATCTRRTASTWFPRWLRARCPSTHRAYGSEARSPASASPTPPTPPTTTTPYVAPSSAWPTPTTMSWSSCTAPVRRSVRTPSTIRCGWSGKGAGRTSTSPSYLGKAHDVPVGARTVMRRPNLGQKCARVRCGQRAAQLAQHCRRPPPNRNHARPGIRGRDSRAGCGHG